MALNPLVMNWGLLAHPIIRALLDREPQVREAVADWIAGKRAENTVVVAGPPSPREIERFRTTSGRRKPGLELPTITLVLQSGRYEGVPAIHITCSAEDLAILAVWATQRRDTAGKLTPPSDPGRALDS